MASGVANVERSLVVVPRGSSASSIQLRAVARRRNLGDLPFVETWKNGERFELLATPLAFAEIVAEELSARGVRARASAAAAPLDAEKTASRYTLLLSAIPRGEAAVVAA